MRVAALGNRELGTHRKAALGLYLGNQPFAFCLFSSIKSIRMSDVLNSTSCLSRRTLQLAQAGRKAGAG